MHASAYMCIHAGPEISVSTTDPPKSLKSYSSWESSCRGQ